MPRTRPFAPFARRVPLRARPQSRTDHVYLFSNPVNAARLREVYDDAVAGRNGIALTREELWRLAGIEPDRVSPGDAQE